MEDTLFFFTRMYGRGLLKRKKGGDMHDVQEA